MKAAKLDRRLLNLVAALTLTSITPRLTAAPKARTAGVLAIVNGATVTVEEIDALLQEELRPLHARIQLAWTNELDLQINSRLLDEEARARGLTTTDLLRDEVLSKVQEPTDEEIESYFDENRERFVGVLEEVSDAIRTELYFLRQQGKAAELAQKLRARAGLARIIERPEPPMVAAERAQVLAVVNGDEITLGDVEDGVRAILFRIEKEIYLRRRAAIERIVNDLLLEEEAKKRGTIPDRLLEAELRRRRRPVTESDARAFFEENGIRLGLDWNDEDERLALLRYLHEEETSRAYAAFAAELRDGTQIEMSLVPPSPPVYDIPTEGEPARGNPNAPVTIVEFVDFACTRCANVEESLARLLQEYGEKLRLVSLDFPLRQEYSDAYRAAVAAEAAYAQGRYWEYRGLLFRDQTALDASTLRAHARSLGLDVDRFDAALEDIRIAAAIDEDRQAGLRFGVAATPSFFVNGRPLQGTSYEDLKAAVDEELTSPSSGRARIEQPHPRSGSPSETRGQGR